MGKPAVHWLHWYPIYQRLLTPLKAEFTAEREAEPKICPSRWTESVGDAVFQRHVQCCSRGAWSQRGSPKAAAPGPANDLLDPGWAELTAETSLIPPVTLETLIWFGLMTRGDFPDIHEELWNLRGRRKYVQITFCINQADFLKKDNMLNQGSYGTSCAY